MRSLKQIKIDRANQISVGQRFLSANGQRRFYDANFTTQSPKTSVFRFNMENYNSLNEYDFSYLMRLALVN